MDSFFIIILNSEKDVLHNEIWLNNLFFVSWLLLTQNGVIKKIKSITELVGWSVCQSPVVWHTYTIFRYSRKCSFCWYKWSKILSHQFGLKIESPHFPYPHLTNFPPMIYDLKNFSIYSILKIVEKRIWRYGIVSIEEMISFPKTFYTFFWEFFLRHHRTVTKLFHSFTFYKNQTQSSWQCWLGMFSKTIWEEPGRLSDVEKQASFLLSTIS